MSACAYLFTIYLNADIFVAMIIIDRQLALADPGPEFLDGEAHGERGDLEEEAQRGPRTEPLVRVRPLKQNAIFAL